MIHIYICESDGNQLIYFKKLLYDFIVVENIDANIVFAKGDPFELLEVAAIEDDNPRLFFIDVQLKGCAIDGFTLVKRLRHLKQNNYFVFLALERESAYKVFEYELDILDYILKESLYSKEPYQKALKSRIDKIFKKINDATKVTKQGTLTLSYGNYLIDVRADDIICVQSVKGKHKVEIYMPDRKIYVRDTLKRIKESLGKEFIYVNKSCIVQNSKIREIDKKNRYIILDNDLKCEVSYREMKNLYTYLANADIFIGD